MDAYNPPEKGRATGAHSRHRGETEHIDTKLLPDSGLRGNIREIIRREPGCEVHRVFTLTCHFEVRTADQQWRYSELWEAICKQIQMRESLAERRDHVS
jgi:hypothetical protein